MPEVSGEAVDTVSGFVGAALIPGMPQLLAAHPSEGWSQLRDEARHVGRLLLAEDPSVLILLSTQWFTVLGHQVQLEPRPHGTRVDENWYAYDFGVLPYDFRVDVELAESWATEMAEAGYQARRTKYDGFPIDTGTIVALRLLDPENSRPVAVVSCNIYASSDDLRGVARCALKAADSLGRRVAFCAVSGLSSGLIQEWIEPSEDRIDPAHDRWNLRILELLAGGKIEEVFDLREQYAREASVDSQLRALAFLAGSGGLNGSAEIRAYAPVWGTGAAVIYWPRIGSEE